MMNSVLKQTSRTLVQRRFQSSKVCTQFMTASKEQSFKKNWLSDPSTYPLIFVMGCATLLCTGVGTACLAYNPDVQINPEKRNSKLRTWSM